MMTKEHSIFSLGFCSILLTACVDIKESEVARLSKSDIFEGSKSAVVRESNKKHDESISTTVFLMKLVIQYLHCFPKYVLQCLNTKHTT